MSSNWIAAGMPVRCIDDHYDQRFTNGKHIDVVDRIDSDAYGQRIWLKDAGTFVRFDAEGSYWERVDARAPAPANNKAPPAPADTPGLFPATVLPDMTSAKRKEYPLVRGCIDYFPDALLAVAHISFLGNQQHNPGHELFWNREKSTDEVDALGRHLAERGRLFDVAGALLEAQVAWRALANLQKRLEKMYNLPLPIGCKPK